MKKILKLQDHRHTAKRIEHAHTSYRALFLIMALFGISIFFVQRSASADSYVVSASVQAPIPTIPAQITSPTDQSTTNSPNIVIGGTCPIIMPAIVVEIFRNDEFIGSAGCSASGEFSGTFTMQYGANNLVPKVITITNDLGPSGSPVVVNYPAPVVQTPTQPSKPAITLPTSTTETAEPFIIKTETPFLIFKQDESFVWKVAIKGGVSPYTILVDWGDGTKSTYAANSSGDQKLEHIFKKNKNTVVRISVKDATGKEVYTTVAGVTFKQTTSPLVNGISASASGGSVPITILWIAYIIIVAMVIAFWLGAKSHRHQVPPLVKKRKLAHKK